jgi:hypothetical protein
MVVGSPPFCSSHASSASGWRGSLVKHDLIDWLDRVPLDPELRQAPLARTESGGIINL